MNARPISFLYVMMTFTVVLIMVFVVVNVFFHEDRICLLKLHEINNLLSVFTETVKLLTNTVTEVCRA